MTDVAFGNEHGPQGPEITQRERALLIEAIASHNAMIACVRAMRTNHELVLIQNTLSCEHFVHAVKIQRDTLKMARRIAVSAETQSGILADRVDALSEMGLHYSGLSDEGHALVVVRR